MTAKSYNRRTCGNNFTCCCGTGVFREQSSAKLERKLNTFWGIPLQEMTRLNADGKQAANKSGRSV